MVNKKYNYVYLVVNTLNNKKYIGKRSSSVEPDRDKYIGSGERLKQAQKKYGIYNFEKFVLEVCDTEEQAFKLESIYIDVLDAVNDREYYNVKNGGIGFRSEYVIGELNPFYGKSHKEETKKRLREYRLGTHHTEETKKKIGEYRQGRVHTQESKEKIRIGNMGKNNPMYGKVGELNHFYGQNHTEETKRKLRKLAKERFKNKANHPMYGKIGPLASFYGKTHTEEIKRRIGEATRIRNKGKYIGADNPNAKSVVMLDEVTGEYLKTFSTIKSANLWLGKTEKAVGISSVVTGKQKKAYGYIWRYLDDFNKELDNDI